MSKADEPTDAAPSTAVTVVTWAAQLVVAGVFAMGAIPKFTGQAGALAEKLPMGSTSVYAIGAIETVAIVLILIPKTAVYGGALAALVMLGAIASHFTIVGFEEPFGAMFAMALVALAGAVAVLALRRRELPI